MAKGGKTNKQMLNMGRNLAKIANQKSGSKPKKDMGKVNKNGNPDVNGFLKEYQKVIQARQKE